MPAAAVRPLHDQIAVRRDAEQEHSGLIHLPEMARKQQITGIVEAVGRGFTRDNGVTFPCDARPGDHVVVGERAGKEVKVDGDGCLIVRDHDVLGVIEGDGSIRLFQKRVMIEREPEEVITASGLVIPEAYRAAATFGRVTAVGPGGRTTDGTRRPVDLDVKVGDRVLFQKWTPDIEVQGRKVTIVDLDEIYGIVED